MLTLSLSLYIFLFAFLSFTLWDEPKWVYLLKEWFSNLSCSPDLFIGQTPPLSLSRIKGSEKQFFFSMRNIFTNFHSNIFWKFCVCVCVQTIPQVYPKLILWNLKFFFLTFKWKKLWRQIKWIIHLMTYLQKVKNRSQPFYLSWST